MLCCCGNILFSSTTSPAEELHRGFPGPRCYLVCPESRVCLRELWKKHVTTTAAA